MNVDLTPRARLILMTIFAVLVVATIALTMGYYVGGWAWARPLNRAPSMLAIPILVVLLLNGFDRQPNVDNESG